MRCACLSGDKEQQQGTVSVCMPLLVAAETGDSVRALVNMIKKEEIMVNVDLRVAIPVCCTPPPCACAGWCCAPLLHRQ